MGTLILPDQKDAKDTIADYLDALHLDSLEKARRDQIISNCVTPVTLLIQAVELATAAGREEEAILLHFIHSLNAQAETSNRLKHFSELLVKLNHIGPAH
jgi:hypothetical protein